MIKHEWHGTVLTITSDSGTSSCDLQGAMGETGIRGPQGIPGINGRNGVDGTVAFEELTEGQVLALKGDYEGLTEAIRQANEERLIGNKS
jgi:hypothetical protein